MLKHTRLLHILPLMLLLSLLSACGINTVGTIPRGTPDTGNGTPAVLPTVTATTPALQAAPANTTGAFYAFVRNSQLWVAMQGKQAAQMTNFNYTNTPEVFWHEPLWSADDHFIAFIMNAVPMGLGGGGCPGPDYGANGALYVLNTANGQFTQVTLPVVKSNVQVNGMPQNDMWQYAFWEDATHIVAWYNGVLGKVSNTAGLYRYDVVAGTLTQIMPLSALGVATLYAPQQNMPLLLSLRYSSGQLFYQVVVHPFGQQSQLVIYRRSLAQPTAQSSQVVAVGNEAWCATPTGQAFVKPGWDVSPDGGQVVAQLIVTSGSNQSVGTIEAVNLMDGSKTQLFTSAPADFLGRDEQLTWGPDSQTVIASELHLTGQEGPYSASLANPSAMQQYAPNVAGTVVWRANRANSTSGIAFALQNTDALDSTTPSDVYVFLAGDTQGRMLLTNAYNFSWG